jgi:hypothetical protein
MSYNPVVYPQTRAHNLKYGHINHIEPRVGASPGPPPLRLKHKPSLNIFFMDTYNKQYPWPNGWVVARRLKAVGGGPGVEPRGHSYFTQSTLNKPMSDTWRLLVGPHVFILFVHKLTRANTLLAHIDQIKTCHVTCQCHDSMYGSPMSALYDPATWQYGLPSQHQNFACLAQRTDLNNFSI